MILAGPVRIGILSRGRAALRRSLRSWLRAAAKHGPGNQAVPRGSGSGSVPGKLLFPGRGSVAIRPLINWSRLARPTGRQTAELCCVLDFAGKPALPALLGRGASLAGPSGFWVGHSSECFAVEFMSDREPGLRARLPGSHRPGRAAGPAWSIWIGQAGGFPFPGPFLQPRSLSLADVSFGAGNCSGTRPLGMGSGSPVGKWTL